MLTNSARATTSGKYRRGDSSLLPQQNPHSLFLIVASVIVIATLVVDMVLHRADLNNFVLILLLTLAISLGTGALLLGEQFPRWVGLICFVLFALATVYFVSPLGDEQSAISSLQELPLLALYLGWFVRRPLDRVLMFTMIASLLAAMWVNPIFHVDGSLGVATAAQAIIIACFCFEIGAALWLRSEREVTTDSLTGALNRAGFMSRLETELARSQRSKTAITLVVIDFDKFKQLNDTLGHTAGDAVLVDAVASWQRGVRPRDVVGRTGGDEFAILLDRTDAQAAGSTMRRLRASSPHAWSWGISQAQNSDTAESLFQRADDKLYDAKRSRV